MSPTPAPPGDAATVAEAKAYLRERWLDGADCPCCRRRVQVYRRSVTSGMALALLSFLHASDERHRSDPAFDGFLHAEETFKRSTLLPRSARGDFTKLRFWGIIEGAEGKREDGSRRNGYWRLTPLGRRFARGEASVPKYVYMYNDAVYAAEAVGADPDQSEVTIRDALGVRFDFDQLMRGPGRSGPGGSGPEGIGRRAA